MATERQMLRAVLRNQKELALVLQGISAFACPPGIRWQTYKKGNIQIAQGVIERVNRFVPEEEKR